MKKAAFFAGIFLTVLSVANAQDTSAPATSTPTPAVAAKPAFSNGTVDSIAAKYKLLPMPEAMTPEQVFPVLGEYQPSATPAPEATTSAATSTGSTTTTEAAPAVTSVKIMLDDQNKGIVWVDGLPQGKIKAFLRKSPSTYKIPAQTTADGKEVKEGTMIFDKDTKTLSVIIGKAYNDQDPAAAFAPAVEEPVAAAPVVKKGKKAKKVKPVVVEKPWVLTATKVEHTTASIN
ncbi:MAG: hypothetical protein QM764_12635 [Chitinophagaceae bacterium]